MFLVDALNDFKTSAATLQRELERDDGLALAFPAELPSLDELVSAILEIQVAEL